MSKKQSGIILRIVASRDMSSNSERNFRLEICFLLIVFLQQLCLSLSEEFCHYETFKAECPSDHVILMRSAFYGRKNLGRCVKMNFGFVGCYSSVLSFLDDRCSGRQSCKVEVIEPSFDNIRPCNDELKSYLEADYTCVREMQPIKKIKRKLMQEQSETCHLRLSWKPEHWTLPVLSSNPACGTDQTPWAIHGPSDHLRVKVDLVQFAAETKHASMESPSISVMIREMATASAHAKIMTSHPVQSNSSSALFHPSTNARHQHLHTSLTGSIQVVLRFEQTRAADDFLFLFSVICPEVQLGPNMVAHYSINKSTVKVTCRNDEQSWTLVCRDSGWFGSLGNCSHQTQRLAGPNPPLNGRQSRLRITTAIVAIIVVGVSVSISLCVLVFGLLVMKRIKGSKLFRRSSLLVDQSQTRTNEANNSGSFIALMPRSQAQGQEKVKEFCPLKAQMLAAHHRHFHHQCPVVPLNLTTQLDNQLEPPRDKKLAADHPLPPTDHSQPTHLLDCLQVHSSTTDFFSVGDSVYHHQHQQQQQKNANHLLKCIACSQDHKDPRSHPHEVAFTGTTPPDFLISSISESSHCP